MITNGYLLDADKIEQLNQLRINAIQITLDGPEEVHDTRRLLGSGRPTFRRIIENVRTLMNSSYKGFCSIRVNINKTNIRSFLGLRSQLLEEFEGNPCKVLS